ncbi:hypothetical protein AAFF_G00104870 [Aldrovandia affinis]|uniref:Uncharacterized protein n=1 Tax=Aldrovandia affinis TaxID=143900 RepID=A0AAD7WXR3_9TELE|nr:hypothetical protein AAFF_G00104870 [Aldrovandia affinis]
MEMSRKLEMQTGEEELTGAGGDGGGGVVTVLRRVALRSAGSRSCRVPAPFPSPHGAQTRAARGVWVNYRTTRRGEAFR